jgi:hypothetical protein
MPNQIAIWFGDRGFARGCRPHSLSVQILQQVASFKKTGRIEMSEKETRLEQDKPLTDDQLLNVFRFDVRNSEAIARDFLRETETFRVSRDGANAALRFIEKHTECAALEKENADKDKQIESLTKKLEKIDGILSLSVEEVFFAKKPVFENAENYLAFRVGFTACWKYLHGELQAAAIDAAGENE